MRAPRKYTFTRMTVDEFLAWDPNDRSRRRWQLMDGEPVAMPPGNDAYGSIQAEIGGLIGNHLLERRPGCCAVTATGVIPHIGSKGNFRIPDLGVTCAPPSRDANLPAPLLLIEILSPSNERDTRSNV